MGDKREKTFKKDRDRNEKNLLKKTEIEMRKNIKKNRDRNEKNI